MDQLTPMQIEFNEERNVLVVFDWMRESSSPIASFESPNNAECTKQVYSTSQARSFNLSFTVACDASGAWACTWRKKRGGQACSKTHKHAPNFHARRGACVESTISYKRGPDVPARHIDCDCERKQGRFLLR